MNWKSFWKNLFRRHKCEDLRFIRNVYGDEINLWDGNRSLWRCDGCGEIVSKPEIKIRIGMSQVKITGNVLDPIGEAIVSAGDKIQPIKQRSGDIAYLDFSYDSGSVKE